MAEGSDTPNPQLPSGPAQTAEPSLSLGGERRSSRAPATQIAANEPALSLGDGHNDSAPARHSASMEELEERVRRLEEKYGALEDTRILEDRVVQRLVSRIRRKPATDIRDTASPKPKEPALPPMPPLPKLDGPAATSVEELMEPEPPSPVAAPPAEAPTTIDPLPALEAPVATLLPPPETPIAIAAVAPPPQAPVAAIVPEPPPATAYASKIRWIWRWWLILDVLNEFRVIFRMLVDPRYRLTWPARVVPLVVLVLMWFSDWDKVAFLFPWNLIPILGYYCNKLFQIFLTFVMLKVLLREVERYRDMVPDAPRAMKLPE
jgi:hypothetical protein